MQSTLFTEKKSSKCFARVSYKCERFINYKNYTYNK